MRTSTIALQILCAALGVAFLFLTVHLNGKNTLDGVATACILFMFATILGAKKHIAPNFSQQTRVVFFVLTCLLAIPVITCEVVNMWNDIANSHRGSLSLYFSFLAMTFAAIMAARRSKKDGADHSGSDAQEQQN